jgi:thioredoxin-related protein
MNHIFVKTLLPFVILLSLAGFFVTTNAASVVAPVSETTIKWLSLDEAIKLAEQHRKPILISVYADWSRGCKKMETETFSKSSVVSYINKYYYAVRIDAASNKKIQFEDTKIASQQLIQHIFKVHSYPSVVYINSDKVMTTVPGYQNVDDFEMYLRYFGK